MAPEKNAGRQKRPWWKKEKKTIQLVDGFSIRNFNPDFDIVEAHSPEPKPGMPYIPPDEIWIDERFEGERDFLLKVLWNERRCKEQSEEAMRAWLNEQLAERKGPPSRFELREITARPSRREGDLLIRYVRGEKVRRWWDVWFVFGGHDLIYPSYIPENEVWIDIRQDPREIKYTLHHELHERQNMAKGMSYPKAHDKATASEQKQRSLLLTKKRKRQKNHLKALQVPSFSQVDGYSCGTTSLKCVTWFHGKRFSKKQLNDLCGLTEDGIDHDPLAIGATETGAYAFMKEEGTLSELRYFLGKGLPVIVGWWSFSKEDTEEGYGHFNASWDRDAREEWDCGHYSVVFHMSEEYIWLMDPQEFCANGEIVKGGERRFRTKDFLKHWYDTDTDDYRKVGRWMLVVNYNKETYSDRFEGGKDFLPTVEE